MAVVDAEIEIRARLAIESLGRRVAVAGVYLFGSHVYGHPDKWSDIDIAAFVDGLDGWTLRDQVEISSAVQKEVGNDIELHFFPAESLRDAEPASFAAYVLRHGVALPLLTN